MPERAVYDAESSWCARGVCGAESDGEEKYILFSSD
jgi:hypothetical protein